MNIQTLLTTVLKFDVYYSQLRQLQQILKSNVCLQITATAPHSLPLELTVLLVHTIVQRRDARSFLFCSPTQ